MAVVIGAAIGMVAAFFVVWPLLGGRIAAEASGVDSEHVELLFEKERMLQALKEIDFDHQMGKLTDEDHQRLRGDYRNRAVAILRELEGEGLDADLEAAIEADVAKAQATPVDDAELESPTGPRYCAACGAGLGPAAAFCAGCGNAVAKAS